MKRFILALSALACLSACSHECPDKDVITTTKMVCIMKKDTTQAQVFERTYKWHIRDGKVFSCNNGKDTESEFIYADGKFVMEDEKFLNYCE